MRFHTLRGSFGDWLKHHRKNELDITQRQFAYKVGCSVSTIESYEQNRFPPSKAMAQRIAEVLTYPDIQTFVAFARQRQARSDTSGLVASVMTFEMASQRVAVSHTLGMVVCTTPEEAEAYYWARYGSHLLHLFFGEQVALPKTVEGWAILAEATGEVQQARRVAWSKM